LQSGAINLSRSGSGQAAAPSPRTFGTFPRESWSFSSSTSFTVKQGQYLAFIDHYSRLHGVPPAESDFRAFSKVTPPVVHQMIKTLHARGFIDRAAGKARSITLRLSRAHLPDLEPPGLGEPLLNSGAGMTAKRARGTSASRREERGIHSRSHEKGASRCSPRETRQESDCLDVLTGEEAGAVLRALLKAHPDLLPDARLAADKLLATVSFSDVAERVCAGLRALDLDDLDAGAWQWLCRTLRSGLVCDRGRRCALHQRPRTPCQTPA